MIRCSFALSKRNRISEASAEVSLAHYPQNEHRKKHEKMVSHGKKIPICEARR